MPQLNPPTVTKDGTFRTLNITAATVVKASRGQLYQISVLVAGSAVGGAYDLAVTSGAGIANQLFVIPNTVGIYKINMPANTGILIVPGTGQTVAVSYL